jgi:hypothetical protein
MEVGQDRGHTGRRPNILLVRLDGDLAESIILRRRNIILQRVEIEFGDGHDRTEIRVEIVDARTRIP